MAGKRGPSVSERIVQTLMDHGPLTVSDMLPYIKGIEAKSIHNKCLEMAKMKRPEFPNGLMSHNEQMIWTLEKGVTPMTLATGERQRVEEDNPMADEEKEPKEPKEPGPAQPKENLPLDPHDQFAKLVKSTGVKADIVPTITDTFFSGDITKLDWLKQVLLRNSIGFVTPNQARVIITNWAQTTGLPYSDADFPLENPDKGKTDKEEPPQQQIPLAAKVAQEAGIGFKVEKDKDGDWVVKPGGPLQYENALSAAERQNAIRAMGFSNTPSAADDGGDAGDGRTPARGAKPVVDFRDKLLERILDKVILDGVGGNKANDPVVAELRAQNQTLMASIQAMKDEQEKARLDRIEANIAQLAARDPFSDPNELARLRQAIGVNGSAVTDSSPAVQMLKDSTDKFDKNVNRLVGMFEQFALKSDAFNPEKTRTPAQQEDKASRLLNQAQGGDNVKSLRARTFGV